MKRSIILGTVQGLAILVVIVLGVLIAYAADILTVDKDGTVRLVITDTGKVGIGTNNPTGIDALSKLTVEGDTNEYGQVSVASHSPTATDMAGVYKVFGSRGSASSPVALQGNDRFGLLLAQGYDGDSYAGSASVEFRVDGTVTTTSLPSMIAFTTTNEGASSRSTKMTIENNGTVAIGTTNPASGAKLEIAGTDGALLIPRLTTAQRDALTAADGMIIYNTSTSAFNFRENGAWVTK